ncbi:uncharacterized protein LOC116213318 [Punica granatum]|uniref:Uncharacterized protein LOC116213318 n=1 Tax=Punica granatum TaxID=22663 RepID=A0A218WD88_PUNGR|nr:uncharacterized protein LOC116213318 [Punica granatum]OWM70795.1 hypothetical protein CDL15_Pgr014468 [Punica granatum]
MKVSGLPTALLSGVAAAALMLLLLLPVTDESEVSARNANGGAVAIGPLGRKLKEDGYGRGTDEGTDDSNVGMRDYSPIDPVPSSKTSIRAGPSTMGLPSYLTYRILHLLVLPCKAGKIRLKMLFSSLLLVSIEFVDTSNPGVAVCILSFVE